jgi:hypothetical protein
VPIIRLRHHYERVPHVERRPACVSSASQVPSVLLSEPATAADWRKARRDTAALDTVLGTQEYFATQRKPEAPRKTPTIVTTASAVSIGHYILHILGCMAARFACRPTFVLSTTSMANKHDEVCLQVAGSSQSEEGLVVYSCSSSCPML